MGVKITICLVSFLFLGACATEEKERLPIRALSPEEVMDLRVSLEEFPICSLMNDPLYIELFNPFEDTILVRKSGYYDDGCWISLHERRYMYSDDRDSIVGYSRGIGDMFEYNPPYDTILPQGIKFYIAEDRRFLIGSSANVPDSVAFIQNYYSYMRKTVDQDIQPTEYFRLLLKVNKSTGEVVQMPFILAGDP